MREPTVQSSPQRPCALDARVQLTWLSAGEQVQATAYYKAADTTDSVVTNKFLLKAKFHYASWFGAGSEPVRSWCGAGSKLVRSWFDPDSVMEFGFNG